MRKILLVIVAGFCSLLVLGQNVETGIEVVKYLASDKLEGRFPGTKGDDYSIKFIAKKFDTYNISSFEPNYVHSFELLTSIKSGEATYATLNDKKLEFGKEYVPMAFSASVEYKGELIFVDSVNSKEKVNNKWVLVKINNGNSKELNYRDLIDLSISFANEGAAGVVFVAMQNFENGKELVPFKYSRSVSPIGIPVIQISREILLGILNANGYKGNDLEDSFDFLSKSNGLLNLSSSVEIDTIMSTTANIAGFVESKKTEQWIVIGAHYDHLGYGGSGSGSRAPKIQEIHNGADDNASGVGLVVMLAEYYSKNNPEANIAFVLFGAEEEGLIGSKHFVENLPIDKEKIKMMIKFDMVGRLSDAGVSIMGATTAEEFDSVLNIYQSEKLPLRIGGGGYSGSDQASFYSEKIPVLFFSTGMHGDYHKPSDDVDKINFDGMQQIAELLVKITNEFAKDNLQLTYKEAPVQQSGGHGSKMKVKLGIMPDMTSRDNNGLGVDGVTPGGVADVSGIQKGDRIIELNGKKVSGIYEYMHIMSEFNPNDKIPAKLIRDKKQIEIIIEF